MNTTTATTVVDYFGTWAVVPAPLFAAIVLFFVFAYYMRAPTPTAQQNKRTLRYRGANVVLSAAVVVAASACGGDDEPLEVLVRCVQIDTDNWVPQHGLPDTPLAVIVDSPITTPIAGQLSDDLIPCGECVSRNAPRVNDEDMAAYDAQVCAPRRVGAE